MIVVMKTFRNPLVFGCLPRSTMGTLHGKQFRMRAGGSYVALGGTTGGIGQMVGSGWRLGEGERATSGYCTTPAAPSTPELSLRFVLICQRIFTLFGKWNKDVYLPNVGIAA
jgi:hypothetical protein